MPLIPNARDRIRVNLQKLSVGKKPPPVLIGHLTEEQLNEINTQRSAEGLPKINDEVVFVGKHVYQSRIVRDGYSIDDVIDQIISGMDASSTVIEFEIMTAMENRNPRTDRYGNVVIDKIVFECMGRHPRPELYSVIPKGDTNMPRNAKEAIPVDSLSQNLSDSPG
jgi:hypothetical protein